MEEGDEQLSKPSTLRWKILRNALLSRPPSQSGISLLARSNNKRVL